MDVATKMERKTANQVLADALAYFMEKTGMTQAALAKRADIGQTTVSLYLTPDRRKAGKSGKEPSAKISEVERLADALGVQMWELLRPMSPERREFYRSMEALLLSGKLPAQTQTAPVAPPAPRRPAKADPVSDYADELARAFRDGAAGLSPVDQYRMFQWLQAEARHGAPPQVDGHAIVPAESPSPERTAGPQTRLARSRSGK